MTLLARMPIGRKVTLSIVGVSAMALLISSFAFLAYDRVSSEEDMVRRLSGEAEIVGFNSATAIVFGDPESASTTLGALRADLPIVSAAIYTAQGDLFATYQRRGAVAERPPPRLPNPEPPPHRIVGSNLVVSRPILFQASRVGTLMIYSDLSERTARLRRYGLLVALVSMGALAVALLAGAAIQRLITGPILSLARVARGVSERNDFTPRVPPVGSRDELAVLVSAFNQMLEGLQRRDEELGEARVELERRLEERTLLYSQAAEANRLKDEFLATLSHELRTPLNAIVGWSALMVQGDLDPELQDRAVAAIDRNARAQAKLIEDVLDVSRIVSGKLFLRVQPVDLAALVRAAADTLSHAAAARSITLTVQVDDRLGDIVADPDRLQQVIWNLLSNAIKFTGSEGHVTISVTRTRSQAQIVVTDDGIGIPAEFLPHVFERFRQADSSSTRAHGGLGLGLAIVRHLVEMHGGTVTADSPGSGQGSTFTVTLPVVPLARSRDSRRGPQAAQTEPDRPGVRVLLIGGDDERRELARAGLAARGAEVVAALTVADGMGALRGEAPDVIVHHLEAEEGGDRLITELRALPRGRGGDVPAIAISRQSRSEDRVRVLVAGYQAFLSEPVNPRELAAVVLSLAGRAVEPSPRR